MLCFRQLPYLSAAKIFLQSRTRFWERNGESGFGLRRDCPAAACDSVPLADYGKAGLTDRSYPVGMLMFYTLFRVIGPEQFDRIYQEFFQSHRETGATSADLIAAFVSADPRTRRIFEDWFTTSRWYDELAGKTVEQMIESY